MNLPLFLLATLRRYWPVIPIILALALFWRVDSLRAGYKADLATEQAARAVDRASYEAAQIEAANMALTQRARDESEYQEKADEADKQIAGLRDDLRARLMRAEAAGRASRAAVAASQGGDSRLPESLPAAAAVDSGPVQIDADTLAGLAAYAIAAHEWALSLEPQ